MLDWQLRECYKIKEGKKTEEQEIQTFILGFSQYLGSKIPLWFPPFYQKPNQEYEENKRTETNTGLVSTTTAAGVEDARSFAAKTKLTVGGENKGLKKGSLGWPSWPGTNTVGNLAITLAINSCLSES